MRKVLFTLCCLFAAAVANAQTYTTINSGTNVLNVGATIVHPSGFFVNNGTWTDTTSPGRFDVDGGIGFSGSGTTLMYDLNFINGGTSSLASQVSVYNTATINAGTSVIANAGNLWLRTDILPHYTTANLVVHGVLTGTVNGLVAYSTATIGCGVVSYTPTLSTNVSGTVVLYQWESSPNNSTWTPVSGATNATYVPTVTADVYYRVNFTTTNSSFNNNSASIFLNGPAAIPVISGNLTLSTAITTSLTATPSGGTWLSVSPGVATIGSSSGVVTGVSLGTSVISFTSTIGCVGTATVNVLVPTNGLDFDGSDYVSLPPAVGTGLTEITVEAWVKINVNTGTWEAILSSAANEFIHFQTGVGGGIVVYTNAGIVNLPIIFNTPTGVWRHMALTCKSGASAVFVDGVQVGVTNTMAFSSIVASSSLSVGRGFGGGRFLNGTVDEMRIWNVARTQSQIIADMNCDVSQQPGLVAYYRFNQGNAGAANPGLTCALDYSGNSHRGTLTGFALTGSTSNWVTGAVGNCSSATPIAPGTFSGNTPVCVGNTITLSNANAGGVWSTASANVTVNSTTGLVTGVTGGTATVDYFLNCSTSSVVVTVNALPVPTFTITPNPVCTGSPTTLTGSGSYPTYEWDLGDGSPFVITSAPTISTAHIYALSSPSITVTLRVTDNMGCSGTTTNTVTVNPLPVPTFTVTPSPGCAGAPTSFTTGGSYVTWEFDYDDGTPPVFIPGPAPPTPTHTYTAAGAYQPKVRATDNQGCVGEAAIVTLTVNPTPVVTVNTVTPICAGNSTGLTASGSGIVTYTWDISDGLSATTGASVVASPTVTTTYTITATNGFGCPGITTVTVSVNPLPVPTFTVTPNPLCAGAAGLFAGSGSYPIYTWNFGDATTTTGNNPSKSYTPFGTYVPTLTVTDGNGCSGSSALTVTVNAVPAVSGGSNVSICTGDNTVLTASGATTYTWAPNTNLSATTGVSVTASPTVTVIYTVTGTSLGCSNTATVQVSVNPAPVPISGSGLGNILLVAGNGSAGPGGDNGPATIANLNGPTGACTDASGNVYIADRDNHRIRRVDAVTGVITTIAGTGTLGSSGNGGPATAANLNAPYDVHVSSAGEIYIAENSHIVRKISTSGVITLVAGTANVNGFFGDGGQATAAQMASPRAVVTDASGNVYIADAGNGRIRRVNTSGIISTIAGNGIGASAGDGGPATAAIFNVMIRISMDPAGNIYTVENIGNTVRMINTSGIVSRIAGSGTSGSTGDGGPATAARLNQPWGVSADASGNVYIADFGNHKVRMVNTSGIITTIAGNGAATNTGDGGPATASTIHGPLSTSIDASGNLLVTSFSGHKMRRILLSSTGSVCTGASITMSDATSGGTWSANNTNVALTGTASTTVTVTGMVAGVSILSYTLPTGCFTTTTITVNPTPSAISGTASVCVGLTTTLSATPSGGTWTSSNGNSTVGSSSGIVTGVTPGTSVITYTAPGGCTSNRTLTVTSTPGAITGTAVVCVSSTTTLNCTPPGGTWTSSNINASVGSATGIVTGLAGGTATISYSFGPGCTATQVVTVNPQPVPTFTVSPGATTCVGTTVTYTTQSGQSNYIWSLSGTPGINYFIMSGGTGTGSNTVSLIWLTAGSKTVTVNYTNSNGCTGASPASNTTIANARPVPTFTSTPPSTYCPFTSVTYTTQPGQSGYIWLVSGTAGVDYTITTGSFSGTSSSATLYWMTPGTKTVSVNYTDVNGCTGASPASNVSTVNPAPSAIGVPGTVCTGAPMTLTSSPFGGTWTSSNTSVATITTLTGVLTGLIPGTTTITYTAPNTCTTATTITVNLSPTSTSSNNSPLCVGGLVNFASSGSGVGTLSYLWSGPAGFSSALTSPAISSVSMANAGTYTMTVTSSPSGCIGVSTTVVTINPVPVAAPTNTSPVCLGGTVNFNAVASAVGVLSYSWTGPSLFTSSLATPSISSVTTANAGTYIITVSTPGSGCIATSTTNVTVNALPAAAPSNSGRICVGATATLIANPALGVTNYSWTGPSGFSSTLANPTVTPTTTSTYSLTVSNSFTGCSSSTIYTTTVTVNPLPSPISGIVPICVGSSLGLSSSPSGGTWSSSMPSVASVVSTTGVVTGVSGGTATITYKLVTGCLTTAPVTINPLPATITGPGTVCLGSTITLANTVSGGTWTSSAPGVASVGSSTGVVTGLSSGTTNITYALTTGCYIVKNVTVDLAPVLSSGNSSPLCIGGTVNLNATTSGSVTYSWSGPAGFTSVSPSPSIGGVTLTNAGTYSVTATGTTTGCVASSTTVVTVNAVPTTTPTNSSPACVGGTVNFNAVATGSGPISYSWSGPASFTSTVATPSISGVTSANAGVYNVVVTAPGAGCSATGTTYVTINTAPTAAPANTSPVCNGSMVTLIANPSSGVTSYSWTGPGGFTSSLANPTVTPTTTTTYSLTVTNSGLSGCGTSVVYTTTATVNPLPASITGTASICPGGLTTFSSITSGGTWSSSNLSRATVGSSSGVVTAVSAGTAIITYTLPTGCFRTRAVTINPISPITGTTAVCIGSTTSLGNAITGGTWTSSNPGQAAVGALSGVVTGMSAGTPTITYTLSTGCFTVATVTVNPASAITGTMTVCAGSATTLSNATSGGVWTSSNPAQATVGSTTGIVTGVSAGTPGITYMLPTGCMATAIITVNPLPATITGTMNVCVGLTTTLGSATSGGTWISSSPALATVGSASGVVTGFSAGTLSISYALPTGCLISAPVTVNPLSITTGTANVCVGLTTTLSNATPGGTWSSSNLSLATVGTTGIVTGVSAGVPNITYTLPTGCSNVTPVTVNPRSAITGTMTVCTGLTTILSNANPGGTWSSSNVGLATVSSSGVVTGVGAGNPVITYTLPTGCFVTAVITVNLTPSAITGTTAICAGSISALSSTSGGTWSSSNTSVATIGSASGIVSALVSGTSTITYTLPAGCSASVIITVNPLPAAITGALTICPGTATTTLSNVTPGGTWSSSTTSVAVINPFTGSLTGVSAGTTIISYTLATGCATSVVFTVNPLPASITGVGAVCVGGTTTLNNISGSSTWSSSNTSVATVGSGTGVVNGVSAGTAVITFTLPTGCYVTTIITVNPLPVAIGGTRVVCVGSTTPLYDLTPGGTWTSSNPSFATVGFTSGVVAGVAAGNPVITYTLSTGCMATAIITVNPLPAAITGTATVCVGLSTNLATTSTGGTWSSSNTAIANVGSSTGVINGIAAGMATITYTLPTGCMTTIIITVNPLPASITGTMTVCIGSTTTLTDITSGGIWSSSAPAVATVGSISGIVSGLTTGTTTITYTLATGCITTAIITVNPLPLPIAGTLTVCAGLTTPLSNPSTGGTWSSSNTGIAAVGLTSGVVTGVSAGTATITYTLPTGCIATAIITVNPLPAGITGTAVVCVGSTTTLSSATPGGAWSSSNIGLATVGSTGIVTGINTGNPVVTYTLPTGCITTIIITVNPTPAAISGTTAICMGSTSMLTTTPPGGLWSSSNLAVAGVGSPSGLVTAVSPGTATITYTLMTGCSRSAIVTINPLPVSITGTATVCAGLTTTLASVTTGGSWSSGNIAIATVGSTGIVTGMSAGTVLITYTLPTGCMVSTLVTVHTTPTTITGTPFVCAGSTTTLASTPTGGTWSSSNISLATVSGGVVNGISAGTPDITYTLPTGCLTFATVTVNPLPASITGTLNVCIGSTTPLSSASTGGTWTSSNSGVAGVGATTGIVNGVAAGTATITYTLTTGCFVTARVTVNPLPVAISGITNVCEGASTLLTNANCCGTWTSSNPSVAMVGSSSGLVTGILAGTVTITYTLPTGCFTTVSFVVNPMPLPITGVTSVCVGLTTTLSSLTSGGTWSSSSSVASVGATTGIVLGVSAGTATISYMLTGGCNVRTIVTVNANPPAITGSDNVCVGSTTLLSNSITTGTYSSSNVAVAMVGSGSGLVTGVSSGTVVITYTLPTGCITVFNMTVSPLPATIGGVTNVCVGLTTTLTNVTTGGTWSSSSTTLATVVPTTGVVTGIAAGTPTITYTLSTGCWATTVITVNPLPASITGTASVCVGSATVLTSATSGGTWSSGSPSIATVGLTSGSVAGVSAGTATITYTLPTGCIATVIITVNPLPAPITGSLTVCAGSTTPMTNTVSGGTWSSSNPTIASVSLTGIVSGLAAGTSVIAYTLPTGCMTTVIITVNPLPFATTGTRTLCVGGTTTLSNASGTATWSSSSPSVASVGSGTGIVSGVSAGVATITFTLGTGCFVTTTVTVNPLPAAIGGTTNVCAGLTTTLTNATTGGVWTSSNMSVAAVGSSTGIVTGMVAGVATITYTLSTGCYVTTSFTVNPLPAVITGTPSVCVGLTTNLSSTTTGGTWSSSNAGIASVGPTSGVVTGISSGTATITYTLPTGCITTRIVTVNPNPTAFTGALVICAGSSTTLSTTPIGGTWTSSDYSVATFGTAPGRVNGVGAGTATITYTLSTGCMQTAIITVNPLPSMIGGPTVVCAGSSITLTNGVTGGTWTSSNMSVATIVSTTGVVNGLTAGTTTITYTLPTGCRRTQIVTVNPLPAAITGTATVCVGSTTTLGTLSGTGAWSSSDAMVATVGAASGIVTGISAGTATITFTLPTGCMVTTTATVEPLPAAITGTLSVCTGLTTSLSSASSGGSWSSSSTSLATVDGAGNVTGISAGYPVITYTLPTGCITTTVVTVNITPVITSTATNVCVGSAITLASTPIGGTWISSNPSEATVGATTGIVNGLAPGTSTITYTLPTGCSSTMVITVDPLPSGITGTMNVCVGATTALNSTTTGGTWSSSNTVLATVDASGIVTGVNGGNPTITYTLPTGCSTTAIITVNPVPLPITGASSVCEGASVTLSNLSGTTTWSSSDPGVASVGAGSGVVTGVSAGIATITFTLGTGCFVTKSITVNPAPLAYTVTGGGSFCAGGAGVAVGLLSSETGVTYQLINGTTSVGSPVAGSTGTSINFGLQTVGGTYTVIATNSTTGCTSVMTGSAIVIADPLAIAYTVTGGGSYCTGGAGVAVGLGGSQAGVDYQLYLDGTPLGSPVAGSGGAISFGLQTGAGTYTVVATVVVSGCVSSMSGSVVITINPLPVAFSVTGGGSYCAGSAGVHIGVSSSATGVNYQLLIGGVPTGLSMSGTGGPLDFGLITTAGVYTVVAVNSVTGCTSNMTGSATVIVNPLPTVYIVTGGGGYCAGGTGVAIGLSGSQSGVDYQLYNGTTMVGSPVAGTGTAISFGLQTMAGTYIVVASTTSPVCTINMSGTAVVTVQPLPGAFVVTGGGSYCAGGSGVAIGLTGSQTGVSYQLYNGSSPSGSPVSGTGGAITFGLQTAPGTYTVVATNVTTGCTNNMTGSATIIVNATPSLMTVTGGGSYCAGGAGVIVGLSGSATGINYQLYRGLSSVGAPVAGVGGAFDFGLQTVAGTYTVRAVDPSTGCAAIMSGSAVITINPLPVVYSVTGGGTVCAGNGVAIGLGSSAVGVNYELITGTTSMGTVAGTGGSISFGPQTVAGTYTVVATNATTGCTRNMFGIATIVVNPRPAAYTVTGGGAYCAGGTGLPIGLSSSAAGVSYRLYRGLIAIGSPVAGTGAALSFGLHLTAGTYTVKATVTATGCTETMTGSAVITINPLPSANTITGGGSYCAGGAGVAVGLSSSATGIDYVLFRGTTSVGTVSGTGGSISFGLQTVAGTYTVVATDVATGCTRNMTGSVTVTIAAAPAIFTVSGGGTYCSGAGFNIYLSGSATGVNYRLYLSGSPIGSPVAGTGTVINFGIYSTPGTYTVVATNATTGCTSNMAGSAVISSGSLPALFTVAGGGSYCAGGTGHLITLSGSSTSTSYQLYRGTAMVGSPVAGTGGAINFGLQTVGGGYNVVATSSAGCTRSMSGSATITVISVPATFTVTGGGGYCFGGSGVSVGLSGSVSGISYRLYRGTTLIATLSGTGSPLNFGLQTVGGTYTVVAYSSITTCTSNMTGSAVVTVNPLPTISGSIYTVAPAASITLTGSISGGTWTSSATSIATIGSSSGVVTGVSLGTATISYTLTTGCRATRTVSVTPTGHRETPGEPVIAASEEMSNIYVAPNPNKGVFAVKGTLGITTDEEVTFEITNMLGQVIYTSKVIAVNGQLDQVLEMKNVANGMYLLSLHSDAVNKVFHIVVEQ